MSKDDNTLLYILLGAALVYFLMRKSSPAVAAPVASVPRLPPASGGMTPATFATPDLTAQAVAATAPATSNTDMGGEDFGVMNPGEGW